MSIETWTTLRGLPHNMVLDIAQTPDGYLWLGTWEGLARFNGYEFEIFDPSNTPSIKDRGIPALTVDHDGALWIGSSRGGITRYYQNQWTHFSSEDGLAGDDILDLIVDRQNRLWIATEDSGVSRYDGTSFKNFGPEDGLINQTILALTADSNGAIWVGSQKGLNRIIGDTVEEFGVANGLPNRPILTLSVGGDNALYVGTEIGLFKNTGQNFQKIDSVPPGTSISRLLSDDRGDLWGATFSSGLIRISAGLFEKLNTRNGLPNNRVTALFQDQDKNIWAGTSSGLVLLKLGDFAVITDRQSLSDNYVRAVMESPTTGDMWFATSNGLNRINEDETQVYTQAEGLYSNSVLSLMESSNGTIWVGTYGAGVNRIYPDGTIDGLNAPVDLPNNHVRAMLQTQDGQIWIGTNAGLVQIHPNGESRTWLRSDGLAREYVTALFEDSNGLLWIGLREGLAQYKNNQIVTLNDIPGYDDSDVFGFYEVQQNHLWAATENGLLSKHPDGDWAIINEQHGLPATAIFGVIGDDGARLWMSTNKGVFMVKRQELIDIINGNSDKINELSVFTEDQGLASRQCNGGSIPSVNRSKDGRLWFATAKGAASIQPANLDLFKNTKTPTVAIEKLLVDGNPWPSNIPVEIPPEARQLEFIYTGLNLSQSDNIRYRYQLVGYDNQIQDANTERSARYTNLDPKQYIFRVWAGNKNQFGTEPTTIKVFIKPHFYETNSFRALLLLISILLIWMGVRMRLTSLRKRAEVLSEQVMSRTADLQERTTELEKSDQEKTMLLAQLEAQSHAFERQAKQDALTGLANRRHFDEIMEMEFSRAKKQGSQLSVILFDLDHFKQINDQHSHQTGDEVLKVTADILHENTPDNALVARWGGEEFVMLLPELSTDKTIGIYQAIQKRLKDYPFEKFGLKTQVTISAGVSSEINAINHERLISMADEALYRAKKTGRNNIKSSQNPPTS